jgi:hypothetical protein
LGFLDLNKKGYSREALELEIPECPSEIPDTNQEKIVQKLHSPSAKIA